MLRYQVEIAETILKAEICVLYFRAAPNKQGKIGILTVLNSLMVELYLDD